MKTIARDDEILSKVGTRYPDTYRRIVSLCRHAQKKEIRAVRKELVTLLRRAEFITLSGHTLTAVDPK